MKKVLATVAEWFTIVGLLLGLIGLLFPTAGYYRLDKWDDLKSEWVYDWDWLSFGKLFGKDGNVWVVCALVLAFLCAVLTLLSIVAFKTSMRFVTSIMALGATVIGGLCMVFVRNELMVKTTLCRTEFMGDGIGSIVLGIAYILMIVGATFSLVGATYAKVSSMDNDRTQSSSTKETVMKVAGWMTVASMACILYGLFLPYVKERGVAADHSSFIELVNGKNVLTVCILLLLMLIMYVLSGSSFVLIRAGVRKRLSILMFGTSLAGGIVYGQLMKEFIGNAELLQRDIGALLIGCAYIVLIFASVLTVGLEVANSEYCAKLDATK